MKRSLTLVIAASFLALSTAAVAEKKDKIELSKCEQSYGSIAIVDGDTQGWTKFGLGSPRELISAMAAQSGCFALANESTGEPADYLMNVIAGDKEEVDQGMQMAGAAVREGMLRSGAAGAVLGKVPFGGALFGGLAGLGGKKKTVAAAIRVISPANGQTIVAGSGEARKSQLSFGNRTGWYSGIPQGAGGGYISSKNGKLLSTALIQAFNSVVAQAGALSVARTATAAVPAATMTTAYSVAVDSSLYAGPSKTANIVRSLRAGTALNPTGKKEGLFVEVKDNYGSQGWISVEDLK